MRPARTIATAAILALTAASGGAPAQGALVEVEMIVEVE